MKFGDNKSPNTALFILDKDEHDKINKPIINHLTGLGFPENSPVAVIAESGNLVFEGEAERTVRDTSSGFPADKVEKYPVTKTVRISEIQGLDIIDKSGRSLAKGAFLGAVGLVALGPLGLLGGALIGWRKSYKDFIVIEVKLENHPAYSIVLGGKSQKDLRIYYEDLLRKINEQ